MDGLPLNLVVQEEVTPVKLTDHEIQLLTDHWTDRQQLLEGVMKVKPACIHRQRDLRVWRLKLATAAVDVLCLDLRKNQCRRTGYM